MSRLAPTTPAFPLIAMVRSGLWHGVLLVVSVALHLGVAAWLLHLIYTPKPATAAPQLIVESLELTLAEVESEHATESVPLATATAAAQPLPDVAPYLTAPDSEVALPDLPPTLDTAPPLPDLPTPDFPLPALPEQPTDLPEITLPPMEALQTPQTQPPREATGATARIQHPELLTDLATLQKSYPEEARRNRWEGVVVLRLQISASGRAEAIEVVQSSGYRILDREATKMLRKARFRGGPGELIQKVEYALSK